MSLLTAEQLSWLKKNSIYFSLAIAVFVIFFRSLFADFLLWDDRSIILTNQNVLNFDLRGMFTNLSVGGFYPLVQISFAIDHALFGLNPAVFHFENLIWHIANCILVYFSCKHIFRTSDFSATIVALLFALHPLHVEPVAWVSGRKDLMSTFFYLSSLLSFKKFSTTAQFKFLNISLGLFILGLMSKAMLVTLPIALVLLLWFNKSVPRVYLTTIPFFILSVVTGVIEMVAQKTASLFTAEQPTLLGGLESAFNGLTFYFAKTLWPSRLALYYEPGVFEFSTSEYIFATILAALILAAITMRDLRKSLAFPLLFSLLTILPVLKIVPFGKASLFYDRYMYLPSIGLFILLTSLIIKLSKTKRIQDILICLPLALFAPLSIEQVATWESQKTVWESVLKHYPGTIKAHQNLGLYFMNSNEPKKALPHFAKVLDVQPENLDTGINHAVALSRLGQIEEATRVYEKLVKRHPKQAAIHNNLAYNYLRQNQYGPARQHYSTALKLGMKQPKTFIGLAHTYIVEKDFATALKILAEAPQTTEVQAKIEEIQRSL